jgi:hypothetical protein
MTLTNMLVRISLEHLSSHLEWRLLTIEADVLFTAKPLLNSCLRCYVEYEY